MLQQWTLDVTAIYLIFLTFFRGNVEEKMISLSYRSPSPVAARTHPPPPSRSVTSPPPPSRPPTAPPAHPCVPPPAYTEHGEQGGGESGQVTIMLKCPRVSSYLWCVELYSRVCGGCGSILSFLWLIGHVYVLNQTQDHELRTQRLTIFLRIPVSIKWNIFSSDMWILFWVCVCWCPRYSCATAPSRRGGRRWRCSSSCPWLSSLSTGSGLLISSMARVKVRRQKR